MQRDAILPLRLPAQEAGCGIQDVRQVLGQYVDSVYFWAKKKKKHLQKKLMRQSTENRWNTTFAHIKLLCQSLMCAVCFIFVLVLGMAYKWRTIACVWNEAAHRVPVNWSSGESLHRVYSFLHLFICLFTAFCNKILSANACHNNQTRNRQRSFVLLYYRVCLTTQNGLQTTQLNSRSFQPNPSHSALTPGWW